jgi:hypothetical protein
MEVRRRWLLVTVLMLGIGPVLGAQSISYTIKGTLGPVLSGSDPLGANTKGGELVATVSTTAVPTTTTTSATYTLPVGAIVVYINSKKYTTAKTSTLRFNFPATGRDSIVLTTDVTADGLSATIVGIASLKHGSIPSSVLTHPAKFSPSPQKLTAATTAGGVGSQVSYNVELLGKTVLGLTGSASN